MNLYCVQDSDYEWCCFAFDSSRNRAKKSVADFFDMEYIEMRCKTLRKGVNVPFPTIVADEDDRGYDVVKDCGFGFATEEEGGDSE